jgi:hypothetical protein
MDNIATAISSGNLSVVETGLIVINRLSTLIKLDAKEIHNELKRRASRARTASSYSAQADNSHTPLDLGEGLSANAQREIIEVLLAHPSMFDDVKDKLSPQSFDIPALQLIAQAVFQTLSDQPRAALSVMCSAVEDPQIAGLMTTLEHDGSQKGNFAKRLTDALAALEQSENQKNKIAAGKGDSVLDVSKENRRNMGMI